MACARSVFGSPDTKMTQMRLAQKAQAVPLKLKKMKVDTAGTLAPEMVI